MHQVEVILAPELGNASFLVADTDRGEAVVIDPFRDIEPYLLKAEALHVELKHAVDTHLHNDFVSGCRELAHEAGTNIAELAPRAELVAGSIRLTALHTPGHTQEHKSYLLSDGDRPRALFSGGSVMLGAIARTDLLGSHLAVHLALEALATLQARLRGLPDDLAVYPTHGSGSFCGTGGKSGHETTLGIERSTNPYFQLTEVMPFLARVLDQPRYPAYYNEMAGLNRAGAQLLGRSLPAIARLTAPRVAQLMREGAALVDIRPGREFDREHIPGSYSISLEGPVSAWVGWLIERGRRIVLVGGKERQQRDAQKQLLRIGFDRLEGVLEGGIDAWRAAGNSVSSFDTIEVDRMAEIVLSGESMTVVDVRDEHEWASGHVPGAVHMYVPDVPKRAGEVSREAPVAVHCASGYRAGIAASLFEQAGFARIIHVLGEYSDWDRLHLAQIRE